MAVSPARKAAFDILLRVERDGAWASELLNAQRMERLSREDRALCHELVMTTLRWQSALDARIAKYSSQQLSRLDAEVRTALRLAACQLFYLDRIPAHAAVHESVELVKSAGKRSAAPFANAVLRKIAGEAKSAAPAKQHTEEEGSTTTEGLAAGFAHPEWMVARWIDMYGFKAARAICESDQQPPGIALRLEPGHAGSLAEIEEELAAAGVRLAPGRLLASARRIAGGHFAQCAAFREHRVAVQDEASQLVAALVGQGARILDCCAAPGGKTAAIASRNPDSEIVAVELHEHRAQALKERLRGLYPSKPETGMLGTPMRVKVVTGDAAALEWREKFNCVLADVPCSGTGTLAANPEIKWRLRPGDLERLKDLQVSILRSAAAALAPGGRLVYSTCSLEAEECEAVVEQVLSSSGSLRLMDCNSVLQELKDRGELVWREPESLLRGPYLRTLPGVHPCDGFFAAVLC